MLPPFSKIHFILFIASYNARRSFIALYYTGSFKTAGTQRGTLHSMSAIPHRLMLFFFSCRITQRYNFGLCGISGVALEEE